MRQVFTSPRIENVEGIAKLLRDEGIEVRVTHGRSYKGTIHGNFSYREGQRSGPLPAVWVVKSADQPRARELLRGAGLLESSRPGNFRAPTFRDPEPVTVTTPQQRAFRIKVALLLVIAVVLVLTLARVF